MASTSEQKPKRARTNATDRLYAVLAGIAARNGIVDGSYLIDAEASVLPRQIEEDASLDFKTITTIGAMLSDSFGEIAEHLRSSSAHYLQVFPEITTSLGPRRSLHKTSSSASFLRRVVVDRVKEAAEHLKKIVPEDLLMESDFPLVLAELDLLFVEIDSAEISAKARQKLHRRFYRLKEAIEEYPFRGPSGIAEAFEAAIGAISADPSLRKELSSPQVSPNLQESLLARIKKVAREVVVLLAAANTVYSAYKTFLPEFEKLLTSVSAFSIDSNEPNSGSQQTNLIKI